MYEKAKSATYPDLVVVGAGLFGLTVAQQAVEHTGARVEIIDVRSLLLKEEVEKLRNFAKLESAETLFTKLFEEWSK